MAVSAALRPLRARIGFGEVRHRRLAPVEQTSPARRSPRAIARNPARIAASERVT